MAQASFVIGSSLAAKFTISSQGNSVSICASLNCKDLAIWGAIAFCHF